MLFRFYIVSSVVFLDCCFVTDDFGQINDDDDDDDDGDDDGKLTKLNTGFHRTLLYFVHVCTRKLKKQELA